MHAPLFHKVHLFERSLAVIDHHAIMTLIIATLTFLGFGYVLSSHPSRVWTLQFAQESEDRTPLTLLLDPQYAQEAAVREQAITSHLEGLRKEIQADRAYVVVYTDAAAKADEGWLGPHIARVFEITKTGIAPAFRDFQGLPRQNWLHVQDTACRISVIVADLPKCVGLELDADQRRPVGYIGMEKAQEDMFSAQDLQLLRETARAIETALVKPVAQLEE